MNRVVVLVLLSCLGCKSENALSVDFRTDLVAGLELSEVTVSQVGGSDEILTRFEVRPETPVLRGVRIARIEGLPAGEQTLVARLIGPTGTRIAERRVVAQVRGETVFTMVFTRDCLSVTCPGELQCINGECAPPGCSPEHPELCGDTLCVAALDCAPSTTSCAAAACENGLCFLEPVAGACDVTEACLPGVGCVPRDMPDASAPDAGVPDASAPDAGVPDAGVRDAGTDTRDAGTDAGVPDAGAGRAACCTAWCRDGDRFDGTTYALEAYVASAPGCTSSTGCTCTASALIATSWTVVSGDICDTHDFATSCPGGCDGTQCGIIAITGRLDGATGVCTCEGTIEGRTQDIWDSNCPENADFDSEFVTICPP